MCVLSLCLSTALKLSQRSGVQVVVGGGQEASQVTTTAGKAGRFESRFFHKVIAVWYLSMQIGHVVRSIGLDFNHKAVRMIQQIASIFGLLCIDCLVYSLLLRQQTLGWIVPIRDSLFFLGLPRRVWDCERTLWPCQRSGFPSGWSQASARCILKRLVFEVVCAILH